jgi:hypothetical protein
MAKMSHEQANYHASSSKARRCGTCSMYSENPPSCSLVAKPIRADDVCRYYRKGASHAYQKPGAAGSHV